MEEERAAIEELHRRDVVAARTGDYETLRSLLSDEAVVIGPGAPIQRGREDLDPAYEAMKTAGDELEVLEYEQHFEEVLVIGDYAFEWGTVVGAERSGSGPVRREEWRLVRLLRKEADGAWRVFRVMWNAGPEA